MNEKKLSKAVVMRVLGIILIIVGIMGYNAVSNAERQAAINKLYEEQQERIDALDRAFGHSDND